MHAAPQSLVHTPARQQFVPQQSESMVHAAPVPEHVVGLHTIIPVTASGPQRPLQQSALVVQVAPSTVQVPGLQMRSPVMGSGPQSLLQQSPSTAHEAPSGAHGGGGQHTSAPLESGAQTPQQQTSPNAQASPWLRQHASSPVRSGWHMMSGKASVQHSAVVVHARPGSVQPGVPPRQRLKPPLVGSQPVEPPPFGQQFELAPAPPQTSPGGRHEVAFAQRMIGRPSGVVPARSQAPEQHCASLLQSSSWTRQPPRY